MSTKRHNSPSADASDDRASKRHATEAAVLEDDEDDLADILAQIKQHEESEALARKLQEEWNGSISNGSGTSSHSRSSSSESSILSDNESSKSQHDDEAFARRLAAQWAQEDGIAVEPAASVSTPRVNKGKNRDGIATIPTMQSTIANGDVNQGTPDENLLQYRDFFVGSRNCIECGHELLSPRAYVRCLCCITLCYTC